MILNCTGILRPAWATCDPVLKKDKKKKKECNGVGPSLSKSTPQLVISAQAFLQGSPSEGQGWMRPSSSQAPTPKSTSLMLQHTLPILGRLLPYSIILEYLAKLMPYAVLMAQAFIFGTEGSCSSEMGCTYEHSQEQLRDGVHLQTRASCSPKRTHLQVRAAPMP